jgi:hypothetical protein
MNEQLSIPMPIVAIQVTMVRSPGRGWELVLRDRRQDAGWHVDERYNSMTTDEVLDLALTLLEVRARELG